MDNAGDGDFVCLNWGFSGTSGNDGAERGKWMAVTAGGTNLGKRSDGPYFGIIERTAPP